MTFRPETPLVRRISGISTTLSWAGLAAIFMLLSLAVYHGSLRAPLTGDARLLTYQNAFTRDPGGLARFWTADFFEGAITPGFTYRTGYYRPITNVLFWIEYRLAGSRALLYNLSQVLLHGLSAFLVFLLCLRIRRDHLAAGIAGLLFVLHPVNAFVATEPAALSDVVSPAFYILGLLAFDSALRDAKRLAAAWKIGLAVALYLLAILSKEMGITFPAVLVGLVVYRHFESGVPLRRVAWTLPAWAAFAGYLVWRFGILGLPSPSAGYAGTYPPLVLALDGLKGGLIHISRILLPLGAGYPRLNPQLVNFAGAPLSDPLFYAALAVMLALTVVALLPSRAPVLAFWSGFFLVTYSPLLIVDKTAGSLGLNIILADERWIYLPSVAVVAVAGLGVARLARSYPGRAQRALLAAVMVAIFLLLGRAAAEHAGRAEDPYARLRWLYSLPEERLTRMQKANKLILYARWVAVPTGDLEEAQARAEEAARLAPDSPIPAAALADVLGRSGDWERVNEVLSPWLAPSRSQLEAAAETNPNVLFDLSRVGALIPFTLARASAYLGNGVNAMNLLCESVRRGHDEGAIAELLRVNYAMNGPPRCFGAPDPGACVAGVALPGGDAWKRPFDGASCPAWADLSYVE